MKMVKLKCDNCGGELEVNSEQDKIFCQYCGAKVLINDDAAELRRVEDVKLQARKKNHEQSIKEKKELDELKALDNFKNGKLSKVLLIFAALCGIIAFARGLSLAGVIAFIQAVLFTSSWLLGMEIIKYSNKKLYLILALIGFALIIPFFALNNEKNTYSTLTECKKINFNDIYLKNEIPNINKQNGEIYNDSKDGLRITLCGIDKKAYKKYYDKTLKKGYTIDSEDDTTTYEAYNKEGYKISLNWDEEDKELTIDLDAPVKMKNIIWPTTGLATKIPKPNSTLGKISLDDSDTFSVYIGNTSEQDFENYIKACQEIGFINNHSKTDKSYSAENNESYELTIEFKGNKTMYISVDAPEENESKKETKKEDIPKEDEKSSADSNSTTNNSGLRTDFKNAMDSYEKFVDEYIVFMQKYNSNPTDYELLKEYSTYLTKYNDMLDKFEKWEDEDLNDAETAYYIEVQTRVNKKLATAALE